MPSKKLPRSARWNRLRLDARHTNRLRNLKGRTGLTTNLLCRIGFCLSLSDPLRVAATDYQPDGLELNRSTLLGEWDVAFEALLRQRLLDDGDELDGDLHDAWRAHMNRGAELVANRLRSVEDVVTLLGPEPERAKP